MELDFSDTEDTEKKIDQVLNKSLEELDQPVYSLIDLDEKFLLEELFNAVKIVDDRVHWRNIEIKNRETSRQRYVDGEREDFQPGFEFKEFEWNPQTFKRVLDELIGECERIDRKTVKSYNPEHISVEQFRELWKEVFIEYKSYVKLLSNVEDEEEWRRQCKKLWPLDESVVKKSEKRLEKISPQEEEKTLDAKDLAHRWRETLHELDTDLSVKLDDVGSCRNNLDKNLLLVPEDKKFTESEADQKSSEVFFHTIRSYNGYKVSEKNSLPGLLGFRTPFHESVENGGALYMEFRNGISESREFYHHLNVMASYYTQECLEFREIVEKLMEFGGDPGKCFDIAADNQEVARGHIPFQSKKIWENREELDPLLLGKIGEDFVDVLWKEVGFMLGEPPVKAEQLFNG